jgi:hypothetical protein
MTATAADFTFPSGEAARDELLKAAKAKLLPATLSLVNDQGRYVSNEATINALCSFGFMARKMPCAGTAVHVGALPRGSEYSSCEDNFSGVWTGKAFSIANACGYQGKLWGGGAVKCHCK